MSEDPQPPAPYPLSVSPEMEEKFQRRISGSLLRLRSREPFFAALALFARVVIRLDFPTAATNGRDLFFNPYFVDELNAAELDGLLLHEVLHAALLHVPRRGSREPLLWNFAADIVVNGMIAQVPGFEVGPGALRETSLEHLSTEEVYELLQKDARSIPLNLRADLAEEDEGPGERREILDAYWRHAREQARLIAASQTQGDLPAHMRRELGALEASRLDWRSHLWRHLVRTPIDFAGYDRRFIGRGLYLEDIEGETLHVFVAVDTSGSISPQQMNTFLGEVMGILAAYPHLKCDLYYVDAERHGPYRLDQYAEIPQPIGGGGTDFRPFFNCPEMGLAGHGVAVYLTDGLGHFPEQPPSLPVLWVVTPGGLSEERFPFGEVVRLIEDK